jgi:hypothetical protein
MLACASNIIHPFQRPFDTDVWSVGENTCKLSYVDPTAHLRPYRSFVHILL